MPRAKEESSPSSQREFWPCTRLNLIAINTEQTGARILSPNEFRFCSSSSFLCVLCVKDLGALTFAFTPHRSPRILKIYVECER